MFRFFHTPFPYLNRLRYRSLHVLIILVFSLFFLLVFEPFRITEWLRYPSWLKKFGLISIGVCITLTISVSQLLIRSLVPVKEFRYSHFLLWTLSEILLASLVVTAIFADYSLGFLNEFLVTLKYIPVGLLLPYAFSMLILMLLYQKGMRSLTASSASPENQDLIHFKDERGQAKFSIRKDFILYLESSDNYVTIYYLLEGDVKKEMVRTSMKKMEAFLLPYGLLRCHRSFMVHMDNVHWIKKAGRNYQIKMKNCDTIIPVSRGYDSEVKSMVMQ